MKEEIRRRVRLARRGLRPEWIRQASLRMVRTLTGMEAYRRARTLTCYIARPFEPQTEDLLIHAQASGKRLCVPAHDVASGGYRWAWLDEDTALKPGTSGIPQPSPPVWADDAAPDLHVVPAVAVDRSGHRLGHGGGHFDRLMSGHPATAVALVFEFQIFETIPTAAHDQSVEFVITEQNLYDAGRIAKAMHAGGH